MDSQGTIYVTVEDDVRSYFIEIKANNTKNEAMKFAKHETMIQNWKDWIIQWKPISGTFSVTNKGSNDETNFFIYYGILGFRDRRFLDMISNEYGIFVKIEKTKYMFLEF